MKVTHATGCAAALLALTALAGCDRVGNPMQALGGDIPPPDEFQVIASKPLEMPASSGLPEPRPGAPSPLEHDPHADARAALLGVPSDTAQQSATPSAGEQVLLSSASASASSEEIRVQLEQEESTIAANKPYEPPSVAELLGVSKSENLDESQLLDPQTEAERLRQAGGSVPVDPNPAVEAEKTPQHSEVGEYPPGRPQSPFNKDTTLITN